jgi:hypothetical protein
MVFQITHEYENCASLFLDVTDNIESDEKDISETNSEHSESENKVATENC